MSGVSVVYMYELTKGFGFYLAIRSSYVMGGKFNKLVLSEVLNFTQQWYKYIWDQFWVDDLIVCANLPASLWHLS